MRVSRMSGIALVGFALEAVRYWEQLGWRTSVALALGFAIGVLGCYKVLNDYLRRQAEWHINYFLVVRQS